VTPCIAFATLLAVGLANATPTPIPDPVPNPYPAVNVAIGGRQITMMDIGLFQRGMYSQAVPHIRQIDKPPSEMPADSPYVSFQGRDAGPPVAEIIWLSTGDRDPNAPEAEVRKMNEAYVGAMALAIMDAGRAGSTLQAVFANTPSDRTSRLALGAAVARAFSTASDQSAAYAASEADWIKAHLVPGTSRDAAYDMLRSRNLVAYNTDYAKVIEQPEKFTSSGESLGRTCDMNADRASGNWPYQNEALPKWEGACADLHPGRHFTAEPDANVMLWGGFTVVPPCGCHTLVTITFDAQDRVKAVSLDKPRCPCL
jgi:hypothetical protein